MSPHPSPAQGASDEARAGPPLPAAGIDAQVAFEQVALLYSTTPSRMLIALGFLAVVVLAAWPAGWALPAWALALTAVSFWRVAETRRFRADPDNRTRAAYWRRRYIGWMLLYALGWSAMVVVFGRPDGGPVLTLMLGGVLGIASVAVFTTYSVKAASLCFLAALLGPVIAWFALQGGLAGWATAAGATLYAGVLSLEAVRGERRLAEMIRLRLENAAIADERARALLLAEQSSRTKSRFLAAVSHEMRTPLNGIMGLAESLRDRVRDPVAHGEAAVLLASAQHLSGVIGDLLDLSRLEFGRLRLQAAPFDPAALLRAVAALHQPVAADKGVRLDVAALPAGPMRLGDALRVQQVLHNLLANAVKFTGEGRIEAGLTIEGDQLRYTVRDTGPGVPAEQAEAIFEPFEQAPLPALQQATGLGLTIARRLARAMDGDVQFSASPPQGALFIFALQAPPVAEPAGPAPAPPPTAPGTALRGHVLVVDDNAVNALVAQTMLERLGLASDTAADGEAALERMSAQPYDVVLMDCRMPRLDGLEATRRWRAAETHPRLPIIAVTANVSAEDRRQCLASGMDGFLAKPYLLEELRAVLAPHLGPQAPVPENVAP
jgi:signal transduction histidine kinase/ActR/RegA family two-component response regulator